jgi:hypothetical protein
MPRTLDDGLPLFPSDKEIARALFGSDNDEYAKAFLFATPDTLRPATASRKPGLVFTGRLCCGMPPCPDRRMVQKPGMSPVGRPKR